MVLIAWLLMGWTLFVLASEKDDVDGEWCAGLFLSMILWPFVAFLGILDWFVYLVKLACTTSEEDKRGAAIIYVTTSLTLIGIAWFTS